MGLESEIGEFDVVDKTLAISGAVLGFTAPVVATAYVIHEYNLQGAPAYFGLSIITGVFTGILGIHGASKIINSRRRG